MLQKGRGDMGGSRCGALGDSERPDVHHPEGAPSGRGTAGAKGQLSRLRTQKGAPVAGPWEEGVR